ncbi:MAG: putative peroxidase-related enzyme [Mariniblastus sp.]
MDSAVATATVDSLKSEYTQADLSPTDRAMLDYSVKLTRAPELMVAEDVTRLREFGFDDRAIHDICSIVAYFAFVNRIADGLGVQLESQFGG